MTWKNESLRHAMSAKGIKSSNHYISHGPTYEEKEERILDTLRKMVKQGFTHKQLKQLLDGQSFWNVYGASFVLRDQEDVIEHIESMPSPMHTAAAIYMRENNMLHFVDDENQLIDIPGNYKYIQVGEMDGRPFAVLTKVDIKFDLEV